MNTNIKDIVDRKAIEATIEALVGVLDNLDGDPDLDTNDAEDEHLSGLHGFAIDSRAGCPIADPGEYAYPEWQTRGRHKEPNWRGTLPHEDAEDDDPDTDGSEAEPDFRIGPRTAAGGSGCIISDPDFGGEENGEPEEGYLPI